MLVAFEGNATVDASQVPAVGGDGSSSPPPNLKDRLASSAQSKCVDVPGASHADGMLIDPHDCVTGATNELCREPSAPLEQSTCNPSAANQTLSWLGHRLQFKSSGQYLNGPPMAMP